MTTMRQERPAGSSLKRLWCEISPQTIAAAQSASTIHTRSGGIGRAVPFA